MPNNTHMYTCIYIYYITLQYCIRLQKLQHLSVDDNELTELPFELCALSCLTEIHAANNQLTALPLEFGYLSKLQKLYLQKNNIKELPEVCYVLELFFLGNNNRV